MMLSVVVLHPLQLLAGQDLSGPHITKSITWINILARLSILILNKTHPSVITTSPILDMKGFLATELLLLKSNKEYVLTFKILAQVLVGLIFTTLANWYRQCCTTQLIKHSIYQLPSLGISWLVE
jgi:hypothetical protein